MVGHGGHTIGAADGGIGMNGSRKHRDLRIARFFALHALQAFPILGYLSSRAAWNTGAQMTMVLVLNALYTGGVWFLFNLAMQGRPPASPI